MWDAKAMSEAKFAVEISKTIFVWTANAFISLTNMLKTIVADGGIKKIVYGRVHGLKLHQKTEWGTDNLKSKTDVFYCLNFKMWHIVRFLIQSLKRCKYLDSNSNTIGFFIFKISFCQQLLVTKPFIFKIFLECRKKQFLKFLGCKMTENVISEVQCFYSKSAECAKK